MEPVIVDAAAVCCAMISTIITWSEEEDVAAAVVAFFSAFVLPVLLLLLLIVTTSDVWLFWIPIKVNWTTIPNTSVILERWPLHLALSTATTNPAPVELYYYCSYTKVL
jgi:hypothetical protein